MKPFRYLRARSEQEAFDAKGEYLAGGTSLLYELDLSKTESQTNDQTSELANRVVAVLKKRVDPYGQKNLIWRVIAGKRIQIQMRFFWP